MRYKFRKGDNDNILFVTSRCSNQCIMCCQPPAADRDYASLVARNMNLIETADSDTDEICITGGEPTLIGKDLFAYMDKIWNRLPEVSIHLLTNGRAFSSVSYLSEFISHIRGRICFGIPIHSDNCVDHDYIAGAHNSFYQTADGLQNLGKLHYDIELRVILIKQNVTRLPQIAEFIVMNLPFVSQVSFMGLEITGSALTNFDAIVAQPYLFTKSLSRAIRILTNCNIRSRIFNLPLCLIPKGVWPYSCRSISNWKLKYSKKCRTCAVKSECCGMFSTSSIELNDINPISTGFRLNLDIGK